MPFRDIEGFDAETLRDMTQAFEAACDRLALAPGDPRRAELADEIVRLAARGEREPAMLFAYAIEALDVE